MNNHRITYSYDLIRLLGGTSHKLDSVFSREQARDLARLDRQNLRSNNLIEFPVEYVVQNIATAKVVESVILT